MSQTNWFKNTIIYHILIDRFSGFKSTKGWLNPNFMGGNIKSIKKKIPYLKKLGIETVWISPFYQSSQYHGYHITDFYKVDYHFGSSQDVKDLINEIHRNNMYIIADFVPNHCSDIHPFFLKAKKNKKSEYYKWFYFKSWPNNYLCFLSVKQLPKINLNNTKARNHIINSAKHWLSLGFDGFRLDHVIGPSHDFWYQFKKEIKKMFTNIVLIGEAWMKGIRFSELRTIKVRGKYWKWLNGASSDKLLSSYINILDGVLDFRFQELIKSYVAFNNITKSEFYDLIDKHYKGYPKAYFLPTFLDNHDMNRFLFECKNNKDKLRKAAEIQFSIDQPKIIYYGTETGLSQGKSIWELQNYGDIQARMPMNWKEIDVKLFNYYKKLIANRK